MVRCNLSVLLAERNLKITDVSKDTKISRTTLTSLANNYSKGIQYDTLNTLCSYLHVTPSDLISYVPTDIEIISAYYTLGIKEFNIEAKITQNGITRNCNLCGIASLYYYGRDYPRSEQDKPNGINVIIKLWDKSIDPSLDDENLFIVNAFKYLSVAFLEDIRCQILYKLGETIDRELGRDAILTPFHFHITWDESLNTAYKPPTSE